MPPNIKFILSLAISIFVSVGLGAALITGQTPVVTSADTAITNASPGTTPSDHVVTHAITSIDLLFEPTGHDPGGAVPLLAAGLNTSTNSSVNANDMIDTGVTALINPAICKEVTATHVADCKPAIALRLASNPAYTMDNDRIGLKPVIFDVIAAGLAPDIYRV